MARSNEILVGIRIVFGTAAGGLLGAALGDRDASAGRFTLFRPGMHLCAPCSVALAFLINIFCERPARAENCCTDQTEELRETAAAAGSILCASRRR